DDVVEEVGRRRRGRGEAEDRQLQRQQKECCRHAGRRGDQGDREADERQEGARDVHRRSLDHLGIEPGVGKELRLQKLDITATTVSFRAGFPWEDIVIAQRYFFPVARGDVMTFSVKTFGWPCEERSKESVPFLNPLVTFCVP